MKRYDQYCPIAHALEAVGERWSLLIVRELLHGPKRYTDLAARPARHRHEHPRGAAARPRGGRRRWRSGSSPPPAAVTVYELTEYGRELEEALHALARWGARSLGPPTDGRSARPGLEPERVAARVRPRGAARRARTYVLRIGDEVASMRVDDGTVVAARGAAEAPDLVVIDDATCFYHLFELVARDVSRRGALAEGRACGSRATQDEFERLARRCSASQPRLRRSTSHARLTSSSVVRALPIASRST